MILFKKINVRLITIFLFSIGVFCILFLSWKTNPNLKELPFIPNWLSDWTDQVRNNRRRTAVPFVGLGLLSGLYLFIIKRTALWFWIYAWLILLIVVCLAEVVQYFLPSRSLDMKDIIWGTTGAAIGLSTSFLIWIIARALKRLKYRNKTR